MESKLIVCSLNQLKIGLWEDMRLLFGNTEVQNHWKYTLPAESSPFRYLYFHSISMAVLGNRHSHEKTRKYKLQDKKPQLAPEWRRKEKSIEMTIEPVELCISISPHFKAFCNLFPFV